MSLFICLYFSNCMFWAPFFSLNFLDFFFCFVVLFLKCSLFICTYIWHFTRIDYIPSPHFIFATFTFRHSDMVARFVLHQNKFRRFESAARDMQNYRRGYPVSCNSTQISKIFLSAVEPHAHVVDLHCRKSRSGGKGRGLWVLLTVCLLSIAAASFATQHLSVFFNLLCRLTCPIWTSTCGGRSHSLTVGFAKTFVWCKFLVVQLFFSQVLCVCVREREVCSGFKFTLFNFRSAHHRLPRPLVWKLWGFGARSHLHPVVSYSVGTFRR